MVSNGSVPNFTNTTHGSHTVIYQADLYIGRCNTPFFGYTYKYLQLEKEVIMALTSPGYKKKLTCDRCGFRARLASQLLVYHVDGDLNNSALKNLRTVCRNCVEEISRTEVIWRPGDLAPDA